MKAQAPRSVRTLLLLPLLLCSVSISHGCATEWLTRKQWVEVKSENFSITSDMPEEKVERLARTLELFRASVLLITNVRTLDSSVPTRVFFFDNEASYRRFRPSRYVLGFFRARLRANFVALIDARRTDTERILRHEYVHFLVRNDSRRVYPMWYDEGFAELLSTTQRVGPHIAVGIVPTDRMQQLKASRWVPLREILAYPGFGWPPWKHAAVYSESWALLHYLSRDLKHAVQLVPSMKIYLDQIEEGADVGTAAAAAFGATPEELDDLVQAHLRGGSFEPLGVRLDRIHWNEETQTRVLPRAEAAARLGELALSGGDEREAKTLFEIAVEVDPTLARARAGLGSVRGLEEQWDEAEQFFTRAVELAPEDPLNQLDLGEYWITRAEATDDSKERGAFVATARPYLELALELDEWKPEPWAIYGASHLVEGEDASKAVSWLEQALALQPSSTRVQLLLAQAYVKTDRDAEARLLLDRIVMWTHEGPMKERAQKLLDELGDTFE